MCNYETIYKSKIDQHHIIPREIAPSRATVPLCKNHHALIYIPKATAGQHAIQVPESIEIIQIYDSTDGKSIHYRDYEGKEFFYFVESKKVVEF